MNWVGFRFPYNIITKIPFVLSLGPIQVDQFTLFEDQTLMMPKSLKAKFWPDSHSHVDAAGSRSRPSGSDRGPHPAKALASTEASFDAAGDESRTKYYPYVEEPSVQPSVAAGEDQGRPCHVHGLRENNTRLAKSLAEDRASSQILPPELYDLEKCNGRLQRTSDAYAESSQPLQETWNSCTVSRPRNASKLPQNEAAYLRQELQVLKVTQSPSKGTMEAIEVPLDRLAARQQQIQACNTEIPPRQNNTDQHQNDLQNQLAFAQRKAQAFEAEVLRMRSYEQDLHETRAILAASEQELRECKDDLFRLQPVTQATDADILRDFQSLCQRINDWIESEISFFEEAHPNVEPRQMFSASRSPEMNNLMQKYPDVGEYQIRKMIHNGLQKIMFDRDVYLFGMPLGLVQTLQKAEQSMAMLEPRRGNYRLQYSGPLRSLIIDRVYNHRYLAIRDSERYIGRRGLREPATAAFGGDESGPFQKSLERFPRH